jgi:hypothetical protein
MVLCRDESAAMNNIIIVISSTCSHITLQISNPIPDAIVSIFNISLPKLPLDAPVTTATLRALDRKDCMRKSRVIARNGKLTFK